jgi:hypothetical protein
LVANTPPDQTTASIQKPHQPVYTAMRGPNQLEQSMVKEK